MGAEGGTLEVLRVHEVVVSQTSAGHRVHGQTGGVSLLGNIVGRLEEADRGSGGFRGGEGDLEVVVLTTGLLGIEDGLVVGGGG